MHIVFYFLSSEKINKPIFDAFRYRKKAYIFSYQVIGEKVQGLLLYRQHWHPERTLKK